MIQALAGLGAFLGGAGQFLGGSGIFSKGGVDVKSIDNQIRAQYRGMRQGAPDLIQYYDQMAKGLKIHPLAALGINPNTPSYAVENKQGPDLYQMGQGLDRMLSAGQSAEKKLAIERAQLENDLLRKQIKAMDPQPVGQGIQVSDLPPPVNRAYSGENALEKVYFHQMSNGEQQLEFLPSQDAADYLSESWVDNMKYRLLKEGQGYKFSVSRVPPQLVEEIRDWLDDLEMYFPPRKGWHYAWNFKTGRPREIKNEKYGRSNLFDSPHWYVPRYSGFDMNKNYNPHRK